LAFLKDNDGFILPDEMKLLVQELRLGKTFPSVIVEQVGGEIGNIKEEFGLF
jgi:Ca2+-binding EF-hand superfamily protein